VVGRKDKGQATDAAAGIICPWLSQRRNKAWYHLSKGGARIYPELIEALAEDGETDTGYLRTGAISIHTDEKKLIAMKERALKRREEAPEIGEVTLLNQQQTKSLLPPLAEEYRSVHVSGAARVDGRNLRNSLLRAAEKLGATMIDGEAVLLQENNRIRGVSLNNEQIMADPLIATSGAWMNELLHPQDIQFVVSAQKSQVMHLQLPDQQTDDWPVVMPPNNQYMLPFDDQRIVIGATHEDHVGFDSSITAGGQRVTLSKSLDVASGLEASNVLVS